MRMNKMITIKNFNLLPAQFIEVSPHKKGEMFSRGKLKVFYTGITADGREFTEQFSQKLLESLPYTPVVSHYNATKDDFEGHAAEQEIYGIVDPVGHVEIQKDDNGTQWVVCDVIIYDKRPDKTGTIASKIIGHAQSLELDPNTVKYDIIRDARGSFKKLVFTEGSFIGVSVLGADQEPAFTGSAFFEKLDPSTFRGKEMDLKIPEFVRLSWGEKGELLCKALYDKYDEAILFIVDIYDEFVIYLCRENDDCVMYKEKYVIDDTKLTLLGDRVAVHPSYEEIPTENSPVDDNPTQVNMTSATNDNSTDAVSAGDSNVDEDSKQVEPVSPAQAAVDNPTEVSIEDAPSVVEGESVSQVESTQEVTPVDQPSDASVAEAQKGLTDNGSDKEEKPESTTPALSSAELEELENYRRKEKVELIDSFSDTIPANEIAEFKQKVDSYTKETLTNELNARYVKYSREQVKNAPVNMSKSVTWHRAPNNSAAPQSSIDEAIAEILRK